MGRDSENERENERNDKNETERDGEREREKEREKKMPFYLFKALVILLSKYSIFR